MTSFQRPIQPLFKKLLFLAFLLLFSVIISAQPDRWERQAAMILMRDGVRLFTKIYTPKDAARDLPILILRTPYGVGGEENFNRQLQPGGTFEYLLEDGYIFVFQDIRGKYRSEGDFVMMRPLADDAESIDEATDAYDTVDWLIDSVAGNNGRAGIFGISYDGLLTVMAALRPHPALAAVSPQASPADQFLLDDFMHFGAFRLSPTFGYTYLVGTSGETRPFAFDQKDTYEWFLELGPIRNANKYLSEAEEGWIDYQEHPNYDAFWKAQSMLTYLDEVQVPTLNVVGWWDAEDFNGSMEIYEEWEKKDPRGINHLAVGPWFHGGWWRTDFTEFGELEFPEDPSRYYRQHIEAPFFRKYLHGEEGIALPEAWVYQTGADAWRTYENWPAGDLSRELSLYPGPDRTLTTSPPEGEGGYSEYVSDPANPVPYVARPIPGFWQDAKSKSHWKVADQRFVQYRPDLLHFETEPLEEDLVLSGEIAAQLYASTTGTDADWIVKLIDVYPEDYPEDPAMGGYQLMIADEVLRGRYRNSFETPEAIPANEVVPFTVQLNNRHHRFRRGHKIMVQIQSTWFPLIDRNPQRFVDIFEAGEDDFQKATHRIYHGPRYPSSITFPVLRAPEPLTVEAPPFEQLLGEYVSEDIGAFFVEQEDEQLFLLRGNSPFTPLTHVRDYLFNGVTGGGKYRVQFLKEGERVTGLVLKVSDAISGERDYRLERKD